MISQCSCSSVEKPRPFQYAKTITLPREPTTVLFVFAPVRLCDRAPMIENYHSEVCIESDQKEANTYSAGSNTDSAAGGSTSPEALIHPGRPPIWETPDIPFLNNQTHACPVWVTLARAHLNLPAAMGTTSSRSSNIAAAVMFTSP